MLARTILICCLLCSASSSAIAQATRPAATRPTLPPAIATLADKIQGKTPKEVLAIFSRDLGKPTRDCGSGLYIPAWDVAGGLLICHPHRGPTFLRGAGDTEQWLLRTRNEIGVNILGSYEMTTTPDPVYHNEFPIGDLKLADHGSYVFKEWEMRDRATAGQRNFFTDNPKGSYTLAYPPALPADTPMEGLDDGALVAELVFKAHGNGAATATYEVRTSPAGRRLRLTAPGGKALPFSLWKGWTTYWNCPPE